MDPELKHDFTNNCLRIEILQKLILENLEASQTPQEEHIQDYLAYLEEQGLYVKKLFKATAS